jgi:hypothetical protein
VLGNSSILSMKTAVQLEVGNTRQMRDLQLIVTALEDADRIISEHLAPDRSKDPEETLNRLIRTLHRPEITRAMARLASGRGV